MSGHNKWSTIKRKKGAADAKRSKVFSRIVKEVQIAVRESGSDPDSNPRLRLAIANAKGANMPKDNLLRAINKAEKEGADLQEVTFEGYGPGGVAIFIECLTDNNLRTVSNMRSIFNKRNGNLGTNGSLSFIFNRKGVFTIQAKEGLDPEEFELELIDFGLEEFDNQNDRYVLITAMEDFNRMQKKLEALNIEVENAELQRIPATTTKLDVESSKKVLQMVEAFEDDDDVQNVYHNLEMTAELEAALEEE